MCIVQWEFQDPKMEVLYHIRPYFGGIFPYIGLTYALYMVGTSNLGSWNGHWLVEIDQCVLVNPENTPIVPSFSNSDLPRKMMVNLGVFSGLTKQNETHNGEIMGFFYGDDLDEW